METDLAQVSLLALNVVQVIVLGLIGRQAAGGNGGGHQRHEGPVVILNVCVEGAGKVVVIAGAGDDEDGVAQRACDRSESEAHERQR